MSKNFSMTMDDYMEKIKRLHGGIVYETCLKFRPLMCNIFCCHGCSSTLTELDLLVEKSHFQFTSSTLTTMSNPGPVSITPISSLSENGQ